MGAAASCGKLALSKTFEHPYNNEITLCFRDLIVIGNGALILIGNAQFLFSNFKRIVSFSEPILVSIWIFTYTRFLIYYGH